MTDKSGWQPIETAPKDGTPILLWKIKTGYGKTNVMVGWRGNESSALWNGPGLRATAEIFSHWMPLPEPPDLTVDALVKAMEGKDGD